jgi:hypothetical protein
LVSLRHQIDVPSAINVPDGGVDAEVSATQFSIPGFLELGLNRFQIKTGGFSPTNSRDVQGLLFNDDGSIKPRVKACLDQDGTFTVALFGWDNPDVSDDQGVEKIRARARKGRTAIRELEDPGLATEQAAWSFSAIPLPRAENHGPRQRHASSPTPVGRARTI